MRWWERGSGSRDGYSPSWSHGSEWVVTLIGRLQSTVRGICAVPKEPPHKWSAHFPGNSANTHTTYTLPGGTLMAVLRLVGERAGASMLLLRTCGFRTHPNVICLEQPRGRRFLLGSQATIEGSVSTLCRQEHHRVRHNRLCRNNCLV